MKRHELKIETVACGTYYEYRATCTCGWGPRIAEEIEYLMAGWTMHERTWLKEHIIELEACIKDAAKLIGPVDLSAEDVARWHRWEDRLAWKETP